MNVAASGLLIPEGPVALSDGTALVVEVGTGHLSRVWPDGRIALVADLGGGPNGAAIGPDGAVYICNNGGGFDCALTDGQLSVALAPERYVGGSIQRVDLDSGAATSLYTHADGKRLLAPNDIVFGADGGFWFTDHGTSTPDAKRYGGIYHALADGSAICRVRSGLLSPNGIGLSPDGRWLYWTDTLSSRLWRAEITGAGRLRDYPGAPGEVVATASGHILFDSLAVEANGLVCIGSIIRGGITIVDPATGAYDQVPVDDAMVTNIAFGGEDGRDAWITAAGTGRLLRGRWPRPGLPLAFTA
ncbi:SMP-30/gluconolactonase/LRE family protein [Sphingobium chlorophenolicum]|uniref:SMP-30/Gluconolaconase/LRE-like region-containing protein n=1 Tax=Sphingobium chlorophenolicum TaxID=46429 RepID=A0A081RGS4_SPHCR|nr:SMP-30/gluconolactonase/LRE family protein [Sphingobium chlorophenolicum]KEQ54397.1 SMP-30/Gluconolaconase/LRE-like region-containing protein [Sphingobium chlorophenolicum]